MCDFGFKVKNTGIKNSIAAFLCDFYKLLYTNKKLKYINALNSFVDLILEKVKDNPIEGFTYFFELFMKFIN